MKITKNWQEFPPAGLKSETAKVTEQLSSSQVAHTVFQKQTALHPRSSHNMNDAGDLGYSGRGWGGGEMRMNRVDFPGRLWDLAH